MTDNGDDNKDNNVAHNYNQLNEEEIEKIVKFVKVYNIVLSEYLKKYGDELYKQLENELNNLDNQNEDMNLKKQILKNFPIFIHYELAIKEKNAIIDHLTEENNKLSLDNQNIIAENNELKTKLEDFYKDLKERMEKTDNKNIFGKTFQNNMFNKDKEILNENSNININNGSDMNNINNAYNTMKEKYNNLLKKENDNLKEKIDYEEIINKIKIENSNLKEQINDLKNRFKKEFDEISKLENDINLKQQIIYRLEIDNKTLNNEINEYKDNYNSLEIRKTKENNNLINELKEIKIDINNYINNNKRLEEENNKYKNENNHLLKEIEGLKFDRDHLTKIIEDSNLIVQNTNEKEKYLDSMINNYKKKVDDINLEKNKLNLKIKMKENKINKLNNEYSNLLKEKINDYEILNNITKNKYEDIINNKENEIKELKANILSYKIEKDKYYYDYNLIQSEYEKLNQLFKTENDFYIKKYEEAQSKLNNISNEYISTIHNLEIKNENLENEMKLIKKENIEYNENKKTCDLKIKTLENKLDELKKINNDLEIKNKDNLQKNAESTKQMERLHAQYQIQLERNKEFHENKIISLENEVEKKKEQMNLLEGRAIVMVKKQQNLTEKYKKELENTINHYENIINGRNPENF